MSLTSPFYRMAFALPKRVRWKLFRTFGGQRYRWPQWIYDSEESYSLRPMREQNCIFLHIPKCAGISVSEALLGGRGGAHATAAEYLSVFGNQWFDQAFKFTFVRSPWTRVVSAFDFLRKGGMHVADKAFGEQYLLGYTDVSDFVLNGLAKPDIRRFNHFRSQMEFLTDPRTGKIAADFIGRFETISEDFERIREKLGVTATLEKKNARAASEKDSALILSREAADYITTFYRRDVEALSYQAAHPYAGQ